MIRQLGLFDNPADAGLKQDYLGIQGLVYLPRLLAPEEQVLAANVDVVFIVAGLVTRVRVTRRWVSAAVIVTAAGTENQCQCQRCR
jgi:hypothetical protein